MNHRATEEQPVYRNVLSGNEISWLDLPAGAAEHYPCPKCSRVPVTRPQELFGDLSSLAARIECECKTQGIVFMCLVCYPRIDFTSFKACKQHAQKLHEHILRRERASREERVLCQNDDSVLEVERHNDNEDDAKFSVRESDMGDTDVILSDIIDDIENVEDDSSGITPGSIRPTAKINHNVGVAALSQESDVNDKRNSQSCVLPFQQLREKCRPPDGEGEFMSLFEPAWKERLPDQYCQKIQDNNAVYFESSSKGMGAVKLVGRSLFPQLYNTTILHPIDALFGLQLSWLVSRLSNREQLVLGSLFEYIDHGRDETVGSECIFFAQPSIPHSVSDLRRFYGRGHNSIPSLTPRPAITKLENGCIYVSIIDCIKDLLGHGHRVSPLSGQDGSRVHAQSPRGKTILKEAGSRFGILPCGEPSCFVLHLYPWEDDFDCNNVKLNRAKAWALLVSVATPQTCIHSNSNTYLVGLGPSEIDKKEVYDMLFADLCKLSQPTGPGMFFIEWNLVVPVFSPTYSYQVDRPAKAGVTYSLSGNGTFHSCFGVSGNLAQISSNLVSCISCFNRRLRMTTDYSHQCERCLDWNIIGAKYFAPKNYPLSMAPDGTNPGDGRIILQVKRVTFATMKVAMENAFLGMVQEKKKDCWTVSQARAYLRVEAIDTSLQESIIEQAKTTREILFPKEARVPTNRRNRNHVQDKVMGGHSPPTKETILCHLTTPATHRYPFVDMRIFINAIMHMIFLGIVKQTFAEFLLGYLTTKRKKSAWVSAANKAIKAIRALRLVNFKIEMLTEKVKKPFGKFVSENYLTLCRLSKWLYAGIGSYSDAADDEKYFDPQDVLPNEYSKRQCVDWLEARDLPFDPKESRDKLVELVLEVIQRNAGRAPPIVEEEILCDESIIAGMMEALLAMVSRIMIKSTIDDKAIRSDVDRHIKFFLTYVAFLCKTRKQSSARGDSGFEEEDEVDEDDDAGEGSLSDGKVPVWIKKYNFITLLTLSEDMVAMGSLRHLYEGDGKGEGGLPAVKESITSMQHSWAFHAAERYYKKRSLQRVSLSLVRSIQMQYAGQRIPGPLKHLAETSQTIFGDFDAMLDNEDNAGEEQYDSEDDNDEADGDGTMNGVLGVIYNDISHHSSSRHVGLTQWGDITREETIREYKTFQLYSTETMALVAFKTGEPLSVVSFLGDRFGLILRKDHLMMELTRTSEPPVSRLGAAYFKWEISTMAVPIPVPSGYRWQSDKMRSAMLRTAVLEIATHNCLFLPHDTSQQENDGRYYVITTEWHELHQEGIFCRPRLSGALYE